MLKKFTYHYPKRKKNIVNQSMALLFAVMRKNQKMLYNINQIVNRPLTLTEWGSETQSLFDFSVPN